MNFLRAGVPAKMVVSANQPFFAPFAGFFHKAFLSDVLVILDGVQFPRGTTWVSRNRFKNSLGTLWLTVPVRKKGLGLQKIDDVRICNDFPWAKKHLESLKASYAHAPYLKDHLPFLEEIFSPASEKLADLNLKIIRYILKELRIDTDIVLLSDLGIETRGAALPIEICAALKSSTFLAQVSAKKYLDSDSFRRAGIKLDYFKPASPVYPQLWGDFIPDLSAFDIIFNCGLKAREILFGA